LGVIAGRDDGSTVHAVASLAIHRSDWRRTTSVSVEVSANVRRTETEG